jgi:hypothetical protein
MGSSVSTNETKEAKAETEAVRFIHKVNPPSCLTRLEPLEKLHRLIVCGGRQMTCSDDAWRIILYHASRNGIKFYHRRKENSDMERTSPLEMAIYYQPRMAHFMMDICETQAADHEEAFLEMQKECSRIILLGRNAVERADSKLFQRIFAFVSADILHTQPGFFVDLLVEDLNQLLPWHFYPCVSQLTEPEFAREDGSGVDVTACNIHGYTATAYLLMERLLCREKRIDVLLSKINSACERRIVYRNALSEHLRLILFDTGYLAIAPLLVLIHLYVITFPYV